MKRANGFSEKKKPDAEVWLGPKYTPFIEMCKVRVWDTSSIMHDVFTKKKLKKIDECQCIMASNLIYLQ